MNKKGKRTKILRLYEDATVSLYNKNGLTKAIPISKTRYPPSEKATLKMAVGCRYDGLDRRFAGGGKFYVNIYESEIDEIEKEIGG